MNILTHKGISTLLFGLCLLATLFLFEPLVGLAKNDSEEEVFFRSILNNQIELEAAFGISPECDSKIPVIIRFDILQDVDGKLGQRNRQDVLSIYRGMTNLNISFSVKWEAIHFETNRGRVSRKAFVVLEFDDSDQFEIELGELPCMASTICAEPVQVPSFDIGTFHIIGPNCTPIKQGEQPSEGP